MQYVRTFIADGQTPRAVAPLFQHVVDTYASETNKTASVWQRFGAGDLDFRPHPRSMTVAETMRHQLLSERRFFAEFLGSTEPAATEICQRSPQSTSTSRALWSWRSPDSPFSLR